MPRTNYKKDGYSRGELDGDMMIGLSLLFIAGRLLVGVIFGV